MQSFTRNSIDSTPPLLSLYLGYVEATAENARRNEVEAVITAAEGSLGAAPLEHWLGWEGAQLGTPQTYRPTGEFDLILANILANVHTVLGADYVSALKPGGLLLTSGIINDREADVAAAFSGGPSVASRATLTSVQ